MLIFRYPLVVMFAVTATLLRIAYYILEKKGNRRRFLTLLTPFLSKIRSERWGF